MRVQFLKDVTVESVCWEEHFFRRFDEVDVDEIISASDEFSHVKLSNGTVLIDVKKDIFKVVVS